MNRTIWIWRMIAILIIIIFTILMWNLYARLTRMQPPTDEASPPAAESSESTSTAIDGEFTFERGHRAHA